MVKSELENWLNALTLLIFEGGYGEDTLRLLAYSGYRDYMEIAFHVKRKGLTTVQDLQCRAYLEKDGKTSFVGSGNILQWAARLGLDVIVENLLRNGRLGYFAN